MKPDFRDLKPGDRVLFTDSRLPRWVGQVEVVDKHEASVRVLFSTGMFPPDNIAGVNGNVEWMRLSAPPPGPST